MLTFWSLDRGVGSFAAEFLARAGVEPCVDGDVVDITNINRQLPALHSTRTLKSQLLETD
jgi:tRNA A37 threonylcarbamoyladenosine dehydratase